MQRGGILYEGVGRPLPVASVVRYGIAGASSEDAPAGRGAIPFRVARGPYWRATKVSSEASGGHAKRTGV